MNSLIPLRNAARRDRRLTATRRPYLGLLNPCALQIIICILPTSANGTKAQARGLSVLERIMMRRPTITTPRWHSRWMMPSKASRCDRIHRDTQISLGGRMRARRGMQLRTLSFRAKMPRATSRICTRRLPCHRDRALPLP